jgi:hypothetical protein
MLLLGRIVIPQIRFYRFVLLEEQRKVRDKVLDDVHCAGEGSHERNWAKEGKKWLTVRERIYFAVL